MPTVTVQAAVERNISVDSVSTGSVGSSTSVSVPRAEVLTADGAASPTVPLTVVKHEGQADLNITVADGFEGATKTFVQVESGGANITFTNDHRPDETHTLGSNSGATITAVFVAGAWAVTNINEVEVVVEEP